MPLATAISSVDFTPESGAWDAVRPGWSQVYGGFAEMGVSVELHDFTTEDELDWGRSFHPESVELCLNISGSGKIVRSRETAVLSAQTAVCYGQIGRGLRAQRAAVDSHRFVTIEFSLPFLARHLADIESQADPVVRRAVFDTRTRSSVGTVRTLTGQQRAFAESFLGPPVAPAARALWYAGKILEALSLFVCAPAPEFFCARQQRLARERVERVQALLIERLEDPPSLEEIGRDVGVSPFYLSRIFSQEMSMTIPQYIRRLRMVRAAGYLREGTHNVTEAAFAVGYSSLGHFSRSFSQEIGCCPGLYPGAR